MDKLNAKELKQMKKHHRKLVDKLIDTVDSVNEDVLSVPFVLHAGISFFAEMALTCAPNKEKALELINFAIKTSLEDHEEEPVVQEGVH